MTRHTGPPVLIGATLVVIFAVVAGLRMLRSPSEERAQRLDDRRVRDLAALSRAVDTFVAREQTLPDGLDDLTPGLTRRSTTRDPESEDPYGYRVTGPRAFELCAEFDDADPAPAAGAFWAHDDGRQCFTLDVKPPQRD